MRGDVERGIAVRGDVLTDQTHEAACGERVIRAQSGDSRRVQRAADAGAVVDVQPIRVVDQIEYQMVGGDDGQARIQRATAAKPYVLDVGVGPEETVHADLLNAPRRAEADVVREL